MYSLQECKLIEAKEVARETRYFSSQINLQRRSISQLDGLIFKGGCGYFQQCDFVREDAINCWNVVAEIDSWSLTKAELI